MEKSEHRRIVVKVGSSTLLTPSGRFNTRLVNSLAGQSAEAMDRGDQILFVTSAAVGMGREQLQGYNGNLVDKQVLAATGQITVIEKWKGAFGRYGIPVGQYLLTEEDVVRLKGTVKSPEWPLVKSLENRVVPIINANDSVNTLELEQLAISADNDRLALFIARLVRADTLIILTDEDGVWDKNKKIIPEITNGEDLSRVHYVEKSKDGTGGMESKVGVSWEFGVKDGGLAVIARGRERLILQRILAGEQIGTRFFDRINIASSKNDRQEVE